MTPRFLDLSERLQPYEDLFREIISTTLRLEIPFFVVGAFARDLILNVVYGIEVKRLTTDIDCGIKVKSWNQFERLKAALSDNGHFKPDSKQQQRLKYDDRVQIDIVPFGAIEKDGVIVWPDEETVMTALGFDEAFRDLITVRLAEDVEINISSLPGLALMKLIAWNDRRFQYRKDAEDLGLLMRTYLDAGNGDRLFTEHADLLVDDFDYELASARVLGRDVAALLTERSIGQVLGILDEQSGEKNQYPLAAAMRGNFYGEFEKSLAMLQAFRQGVLDRV